MSSTYEFLRLGVINFVTLAMSFTAKTWSPCSNSAFLQTQMRQRYLRENAVREV